MIDELVDLALAALTSSRIPSRISRAKLIEELGELLTSGGSMERRENDSTIATFASESVTVH